MLKKLFKAKFTPYDAMSYAEETVEINLVN